MSLDDKPIYSMAAKHKYYGIPYKGGKQGLAKELFNVLPHGGRLVDLFCGGCSMTDYAMVNNLYDSYLANDKDTMITKAYFDALNGRLIPHDLRFVSKEYFHAHPEDAYSHICYSFCNRIQSYIYGTEYERVMKAAHYAICYDDYLPIRDIVSEEVLSYLKSNVDSDDFHVRRLQFTNALNSLINNHVDICELYMKTARKHSVAKHLLYIDHILHLAKPYDHLTTSTLSYEQYEHQEGDVVYCDPPYAGTDEYKRAGVFDTDKFWQWARTREYPVYVSELKAPDDFVSIWAKHRQNHLSRPTAERNCRQQLVENLFIHERFL